MRSGQPRRTPPDKESLPGAAEIAWRAKQIHMPLTESLGATKAQASIMEIVTN